MTPWLSPSATTAPAARIFRSLRAQGEQIVNAVHPADVLTPDVRLGEGVVICAGVVVNTGSVIGDDVILNTGCTVDHHNRVEAHAHVAPGVHLGGNVHVSEGAFVGIGTAVIPGRSIGEWAVIGAGSSVIKDIPPFTTAVGVPTQVIKRHEPLKSRRDRADSYILP
jgi:sugar O-acyltransferase (sialic acid O-acetyltransferase NeuD family)